ncbi:phage major capsid protein [Micrococcus sp. NPDC078436]|uniref:phage major capsid protein n=1 Tax=Micrococcus sp. NPDC078436 TaxID=3154960 RepID=UPI00344EDC5F
MMNLKAQRAAALKAARDIIDGAKSAKRALTQDEQTTVEAKFAEVEQLDVKIKDAEKSDALMARLESHGADPEGTDRDAKSARTLGEHFVKSIGAAGLSRVKSVSGATVAAPEFAPQAKAATDTQGTPAVVAPWLTTFDQTVVRAFRRPVVSDLLGQGTLGAGSNAVSYLVEDALVEGGFTTVAPGGKKPQLHFEDPEQRTDALKKIAGFIKFTDEMVEDAAFLVSEINERGLYLLALAEENQLLNGDGTGSNVLGLRMRSGIQTETAASAADNPDALYRALSKVQTATGLTADGIVINPMDYQALRLRRDGNGQYFGGGFFAGEYGNGGIEWQPPLWGVRTIVSAAVPAGRPLVGAFGAASTVYRKGGVRVESTNSHDVDFTSNIITTRIEERVALAVRVPTAFVDVTLAAAAA